MIVDTMMCQKLNAAVTAVAERGGVALLTAPACSGKTTAVELALAGNPDLRHVQLLGELRSQRSFLWALCAQLGVKVKNSFGAVELLAELRGEHGLLGKTLVLDNGELIANSQLTTVRLLADQLGKLVLVGSEALRSKVMHDDHLSGRVRIPWVLANHPQRLAPAETHKPAVTLAEAQLALGEEFGQEFVATAHTTGFALWGPMMGIAERQRVEWELEARHTGRRPARQADATDASRQARHFKVA